MSYSTELCGRKLRAKLGATLNESVSAAPSSFAQRQLEKMGWKEGTGLGKNAQGMKSHIKVKKREEEQGLGHEKNLALDAANTWWSSSINDTLSRLSSSDKKKKKKKKKEKSKRHYTDEELFAATGGARFGMRAQRRAEGKWARSERRSADAEKEAAERIEWNGLGKAQSSSAMAGGDAGTTTSSTKKRRIDLVTDSSTDDEVVVGKTEMTKEEKRKKKKRKKDKEEQTASVEEEVHEVSDDGEKGDMTHDEGCDEVKKDKKKKKEKKSKKKKKKS